MQVKPLRLVCVLAVAGLGAGVTAQQMDQPGGAARPGQGGAQETTRTTHAGARSGEADYRSCAWLADRDVMGSNNEKVAEVDDLLVDRGTGRVEYAIVTTGSVLGLGGRTIAVPFQSLRWDAKGERFALGATAEDLKGYPRWTEKDWSGLVTSSRQADRPEWGAGRDEGDRERATGDAAPAGADGASFSDYYYNRERRGNVTWDPFGADLDTANPTQITGEVKSLDMYRRSGAGETAIITVADQAGNRQKVALGPLWYISGAPFPPRRGDQITVSAVPVRGGGAEGTLMVATSYSINGQEVTLRQNNTAAWSGQSYENSGRWYAQPYYRNVLVSKLRGAKVDCRATDCGKVDDAIVNVNTGRIEFLSIDPNQNLLGINDTKRLVPWTIATVGLDNSVRLDASKDMLTGGEKTPTDLKNLSRSGYTDNLYRSYQVMPPNWDADAEPGAGGRGGTDGPGGDRR